MSLFSFLFFGKGNLNGVEIERERAKQINFSIKGDRKYGLTSANPGRNTKIPPPKFLFKFVCLSL